MTQGRHRRVGVHIAGRAAGLAPPDEISGSGTVIDLVAGTVCPFAPRGDHMEGFDARWQLFAAEV